MTEWPVVSTCSDLWSLVYDHDCSAVVVLCNPSPGVSNVSNAAISVFNTCLLQKLYASIIHSVRMFSINTTLDSEVPETFLSMITRNEKKHTIICLEYPVYYCFSNHYLHISCVILYTHMYIELKNTFPFLNRSSNRFSISNFRRKGTFGSNQRYVSTLVISAVEP